jgi:hypothetical protein
MPYLFNCIEEKFSTHLVNNFWGRMEHKILKGINYSLTLHSLSKYLLKWKNKKEDPL